MTHNGKIEFLPPPPDWARTKVNGKELWWVCLETASAGSAPPVVAGGGLKGRNYITFSGGYYHQPGWDDANDTDGDGVWDTNGNPNATAVFRYEARVHWYEFETTYLNMGNLDVRTAYASLATTLLTTPVADSGYTYDCLFLDNATARIVIHNLQSGGSTIEDTSDSTWQLNTIDMLRAVKTAVGPDKIVKINTSNWTGAPYEEYIDEVDAWHGENYISSGVTKRTHIDAVISRDARGKYCLVHAQGEGYGDDTERNRMYSLATFYLSKGERTYYQYRRDVLPDQRFVDNWYAAIEYDIGQPLGSYYICHQEDDPSCPHDSYGIANVYAREFDRALVVSCLLPHWDSSYTPSYTVVLPSYDVAGTATSNRYRVLHSDGSLDANVIDTITLRNSDGAVLIKDDINPPALSLHKDVSSAQAALGDYVTYTITYSNEGSEALSGAVLTDELRADLTYVPYDPSTGAGGTYHNGQRLETEPYNPATRRITINLGDLTPGQSGRVTFTVIVGSP